MGPKTFVACYVCFKEYGSRSIPFHVPKCLERWRSSNKNLPAEKRASTPVKPAGWKYSQDSTWVCSHCQVSLPAAKREEHTGICLATQQKTGSLSNNNSPTQKGFMTTTACKIDISPKKGKENKNFSNHIRTPNMVKKNAKNEAKTGVTRSSEKDDEAKNKKPQTEKVDEKIPDKENQENSSSTTKRSIRPQTKILRRPTPNLKHPVIQLDSDDSSGDSSCSDKLKEDNPKRLKMGSDSSDTTHKPKNFIMYNKNNVDKNTKKERASATVPSVPNPCTSCTRSQAPERLHSHSRKDARGLMSRRSPVADVKMTSPQKKPSDALEKNKLEIKEPKNSSIAECEKEEEASSKTSRCVLDSKSESTGATAEQNISYLEPLTSEDDLTELVKSCYICQKEFKVSSLFLHESKCLESWKKINNSLTPNLRKLPPRRLEEGEIRPPQEDDPTWSAVQSQLVPCPVCGRTFFPERMPVHRRVCKGKPSPRPLKRASSLREQSATSRDGEEQRPAAVYVPCYVCGRNYGSWVISMHEQQCLRKWRRDNEKLPDEQQQEEPTKLTGLYSDDDVDSLIELGDNAWESHLQQLVPCPRCSRTFFPDRLGVHERSCKGPSCSRRPRSNKGA